MLKQRQFIQANARWLNEMLVVYFCSLGPFLSQISLLGIETITSSLEHRVYVLTRTELHPHGWSGVCLGPQRYGRCKHASRNELSMGFLKPLCFTWNHRQDTDTGGKKVFSQIFLCTRYRQVKGNIYHFSCSTRDWAWHHSCPDHSCLARLLGEEHNCLIPGMMQVWNNAGLEHLLPAWWNWERWWLYHLGSSCLLQCPGTQPCTFTG